jgi:hypothetical protein
VNKSIEQRLSKARNRLKASNDKFLDYKDMSSQQRNLLYVTSAARLTSLAAGIVTTVVIRKKVPLRYRRVTATSALITSNLSWLVRELNRRTTKAITKPEYRVITVAEVQRFAETNRKATRKQTLRVMNLPNATDASRANAQEREALVNSQMDIMLAWLVATAK